MTSRLLRQLVVLAAALSMAGSAPVLGAGSPSPDPVVTGTWFDGLAAGVCFDSEADGSIDFSVPVRIVPCDGPHNNQVAGLVSLGEGAFPAEDIGPQAGPRCAPAYQAFLGRPVDTSGLTPTQIWPDASDWAHGAHDIVCILFSYGPILGTAASGSLVAPTETLALYREVDGVTELWLADAGTGDLLRRVSDGSLSLVRGSPDWAPDGSGLAVTAAVSATDVDPWFQPIDGAPVAIVTGAGKQDGANFSPDGTSVAYISNEGLPEYEIYTRSLSGGASTRLTQNDLKDASPQWSPDGTRLLFRREIDGISDLWVMDADGTDERRLTDNGAGNYDPRWSPDGSRILFTTKLDGDYDIGIMDADGTGQRLLTDHPADDEYPTWSRDGEFIAFQSSRYGGPAIWLMRADGSEPSLLVAEQPSGTPMFAPVEVAGPTK